VTKEEVKARIDRLFAGESLRKVAGGDGSAIRRFFEAVESDAELLRMYTLAMESKSELMADDVVTIADTEPDSARARVQVDARKWFASVSKPRKFGPKVDINVSGDVNLRTALDAAISRTRSPHLLPGNEASSAIPLPEPTPLIGSSDLQSPSDLDDEKPDSLSRRGK